MKYLIYFVYDSRGRIARYVPELLTALRGYFDTIHVVSNGALAPGQRALLPMADIVQERGNEGFDVGAYKAAIFSNPPEFYRDECHEVTLANFTFFGPIGSFEPYFDWVAANGDAADIWGLSAHKAMDPNPFTGDGILPWHIQSHWISFGRRILQSGDFHRYWSELGPIDSYQDSVLKHESRCTRHFTDLGYASRVFFDDTPLPSAYAAFNQVDCAIEAGLPILKRRLFYHEPIAYYDHFDVNLRRALDLIDEGGLYDAELIWGSVAGTDPGVVYQATDNLRLVPDASIAPPPDDMRADLEAVVLVTGAGGADRIAARIGALGGLVAIRLWVPRGAVPDYDHLTECEVAPYDALPDAIAAIGALARRRAGAGNAPVLFATVGGRGVDALDYGLNHLAADRSVIGHLDREWSRLPVSGLMLPPARSYGAPSAIDVLTPQYREELAADLADLGIVADLSDFVLHSDAGTCWMRPSLLARAAELVGGAAATDGLRGYDDLDAGPSDAPQLDTRKVAALFSVGLPYLAAAMGLHSFVGSNTRALPRNLVKAERRLQMIGQMIPAPDPFAQEANVRFASQLLSFDWRHEAFESRRQAGFDEGFEAGHARGFDAGWKGATDRMMSNGTRTLAALARARSVAALRGIARAARGVLPDRPG